ncbi:LexA repressor [Striga asiatica]|uniref:LexA repressor n=1 Tax=Striga asiatica TaxID=4170 RepID=A0A5A7R340_STRAF|nr:LexA repressor [Striga asiatica]
MCLNTNGRNVDPTCHFPPRDPMKTGFSLSIYLKENSVIFYHEKLAALRRVGGSGLKLNDPTRVKLILTYIWIIEIGQTKIINGSAPDIAGKVSFLTCSSADLVGTDTSQPSFLARWSSRRKINSDSKNNTDINQWCSVAKLLTTSSLPEMSCSWVEKLAVIPYPDFIYDSRFTINKYRSWDMLS